VREQGEGRGARGTPGEKAGAKVQYMRAGPAYPCRCASISYVHNTTLGYNPPSRTLPGLDVCLPWPSFTRDRQTMPACKHSQCQSRPLRFVKQEAAHTQEERAHRYKKSKPTSASTHDKPDVREGRANYLRTDLPHKPKQVKHQHKTPSLQPSLQHTSHGGGKLNLAAQKISNFYKELLQEVLWLGGNKKYPPRL
jgi:hypothetical protein